MSSVNRVILIGRLGKDPEVRYTPQGVAVATFSVGTNKKWRDKDGVTQEKSEWHRINAWAKTAELCGEYLSKGSQVYIEGEIESRKYTDKQGIERYVTEVRANTVQFLTPKSQQQQRSQPDDLGYGEPGQDSDVPF